MKPLEKPWIAALLALSLGGPGCFYLGWRRGVLATLPWLFVVSLLVAGTVRQNDFPQASSFEPLVLIVFLLQTGLACMAYRSCERRNAEAARAAELAASGAPQRVRADGAREIKVIGVLAIGISGLLLVGAAFGLEVDKKITYALIACMALWGLATGIGLLLLRPWARLSSLVFYSLLCISGAVSVALLAVHIFASPDGSITSADNVADIVLAAPCVLITVTIGVKGLAFFKRNDIRGHFGGT